MKKKFQYAMKPSKTLRVPNQQDAFSPADHALLHDARCVAIRACMEKGVSDAADVRRRFPAFSQINTKAQGSLFKCRKIFEKVSMTSSSIPSRQGGAIYVWRISDDKVKAAMDFLKENELMEERI